MFTTIVVALELEDGDNRAISVARALTGLGDVTVELLTVSSPNMPEDIDAFELGKLASANGWPSECYTILHADDAARAITDHVNGRDDVLLVMATTAKRPVLGWLVGSTSEEVLRLTDVPLLLVGPNVPTTFDMKPPTLVGCIDAGDAADAALPVIVSWMKTFRSAEPWIADVVLTDARPEGFIDTERARLGRIAQLLEACGVHAAQRLLLGNEPETSLLQFAAKLTDPIFVVACSRWTDGHAHWHSVTQQLARRSARPVLAAPAHRVPVPSAAPFHTTTAAALT